MAVGRMMPRTKKNKDIVRPRESIGFLLDAYQPEKNAASHIEKIKRTYIRK
jgi:hypothetical protein